MRGTWLVVISHMNVSAAKALVLPPKVSNDIIDVYVDAIRKCVDDTEFREKAKSFVGVYPQYYGKDAKKLMKLATDMRPETKAWLKKWVKESFDVDI